MFRAIANLVALFLPFVYDGLHYLDRMLQYVFAPFLLQPPPPQHVVVVPTTVVVQPQQPLTCYVCTCCQNHVLLDASHCSHCGQVRPVSALVDKWRLYELLYYFFRDGLVYLQHQQLQQQQQSNYHHQVEVEINTLRRMQETINLQQQQQQQQHAAAVITASNNNNYNSFYNYFYNFNNSYNNPHYPCPQQIFDGNVTAPPAIQYDVQQQQQQQETSNSNNNKNIITTTTTTTTTTLSKNSNNYNKNNNNSIDSTLKESIDHQPVDAVVNQEHSPRTTQLDNNNNDVMDHHDQEKLYHNNSSTTAESQHQLQPQPPSPQQRHSTSSTNKNHVPAAAAAAAVTSFLSSSAPCMQQRTRTSLLPSFHSNNNHNNDDDVDDDSFQEKQDHVDDDDDDDGDVNKDDPDHGIKTSSPGGTLASGKKQLHSSEANEEQTRKSTHHDDYVTSDAGEVPETPIIQKGEDMIIDNSRAPCSVAAHVAAAADDDDEDDGSKAGHGQPVPSAAFATSANKPIHADLLPSDQNYCSAEQQQQLEEGEGQTSRSDEGCRGMEQSISDRPTKSAFPHTTDGALVVSAATASTATAASHIPPQSSFECSDQGTKSPEQSEQRLFHRRLRNLKSHLQPGIHDDTALFLEKVPSNSNTRADDDAGAATVQQTTTATTANNTTTTRTRTTRSHFRWESKEVVCQRFWTDPTVVTAENPVHFPRGGYVDPRLVSVGHQLRLDFIQLCCSSSPSTDHKVAAATTPAVVFPRHISAADEIKPGYLKGHLEEPFVSNQFAFTIPPCLLIKRRADHKAIAFITNDQPSQCDTHYDRDTSLLLILSGRKEVYLAPPRQRNPEEVIQNNSTIFESVDPFLDYNRGTLGVEWKKVVMQQGDALLIPRKWLHSVHSYPGTVAVSFQVEIAPIPFDVPSYFNFPTPEEIMAASLQTVSETEQRQQDEGYSLECATDVAMKDPSTEETTPLEKEEATKPIGAMTTETTTATSIAAAGSEISPTVDQLLLESKNSNKKKRNANWMLNSPDLPLATKRRLYLEARPERVAAARSKPSRIRGSRRTRYDCDWCDCAGFARDGEMWFLRLAGDKDMDEKVLPMVLDTPIKFLCLACVPRRGTSVVSPHAILENEDELAAVQKYNFYLGTKVDYQVWSGEYKKEQFL